MLIENETYGGTMLPPNATDWGERIFRYCTFDDLSLEGLSHTGILQGCTMTGCDIYWGHFNTALISSVRFLDCRFRGTAFSTAQIIDCTFERCQFTLDNVGGDCTMTKCIVAATMLDNCSWQTKPGKPRSITSTRFVGCTQQRCRGLEGLF